MFSGKRKTITSPRRTSRYGSSVPGNAPGRREDQLVHEHVIADQQRVLHRRAGNDEGLHQRRGREEQQDDGHRPLGDEPAMHLAGDLLQAAPAAGRRADFLCGHFSHCNG